MVEVSDNSSHEADIVAASGRDGNGMCQTRNDESKEVEGEYKGEFVEHGCGGVVVCVR